MTDLKRNFNFKAGTPRFDILVASALNDTPAMVRHTRDWLIEDVMDGTYDECLVDKIAEVDGLTREYVISAAINIIDWYFEPYFLPSMSIPRAIDHFLAVEEKIPIHIQAALAGDEPLVVSTLHHHCMISTVFCAYRRLLLLGYRRFIVVHSDQNIHHRLPKAIEVMRTHDRSQVELIEFGDGWTERVAQLMRPDSVLLYLGDLPPEVVGRNGDRGEWYSEFSTPPGQRILMEAITGVPVLARLFGGRPVIFDYPPNGGARLRDPTSEQWPTCPLSDWIYWPAIAVREAEARDSSVEHR